MPPSPLIDEPRGVERRLVVVGERRFEVLPAVGRVADAEARRDLAGEAAALEVVDRALATPSAARGRTSPPSSSARCRSVGFRAPCLLAARAPRGTVMPDVARELLDRVEETTAAVFHQEADRRAVRAAAEAVIELLGRADRERRRLLVVERAAGDVVRAGLLQLHVAGRSTSTMSTRASRSG